MTAPSLFPIQPGQLCFCLAPSRSDLRQCLFQLLQSHARGIGADQLAPLRPAPLQACLIVCLCPLELCLIDVRNIDPVKPVAVEICCAKRGNKAGKIGLCIGACVYVRKQDRRLIKIAMQLDIILRQRNVRRQKD